MRGKRTGQEISHCSVIDLMENGPEIRAWNTVKCVFLCRGGSELQRSGGVHIQIGDWRIFFTTFPCLLLLHTFTHVHFALLFSFEKKFPSAGHYNSEQGVGEGIV